MIRKLYRKHTSHKGGYGRPHCIAGELTMARQSVFDMKVSTIYPLLLQKVERKGRSKEELDATIHWLTGYDME